MATLRNLWRRALSACAVAAACALSAHAAPGEAVDAKAAVSPLHATIRAAQRKVVKIYGAGGVRGLEAYQTGILISPQGEVLTANSYVLDADDLTVVLDDGQHIVAKIVGVDQISELAVLQLAGVEESLPAFDLATTAKAQIGDRVLALSNLYNIAGGDEPVSVLQGVVTSIAPLEARRGGFQSNYHGPVYVLDAAANNPGAAGGALVDWNGRLLGVLGKELKSDATGAWLHYALPVEQIAATIERLRKGESIDEPKAALTAADAISLGRLGIVLVPDVIARTPPYIDTVVPESPAARAGLRADDLVVFVAGDPTASCKAVVAAVARQERLDAVSISVLRAGELIEVSLQADEPAPQPDVAAEAPSDATTNRATDTASQTTEP